MSAGRVSWRENAESIIAAVDSGGRIVTGVLVSAAPAAGMLPSAYVTWWHMVDTLHINPFVAAALAFGVDALGIGLAAARASLPRLKLTQHAQKLTVALYSYFGIVAIANICVSVQFAGSVSAMIFESALALLPLPVALLMAVNSEVEAVARDADNFEAKAAALRAEQSAEAAQIRAEERAERAQIRAEKLAEKATATVAQPKPTATGATTAERAASFIMGYYATAQKLPSLKEITEAVGVKASQASEYRKKWKDENHV